jgi:hypothetical protein
MRDIRIEASHRLLDVSSRRRISRCPQQSGHRSHRRCWVVGQDLLNLVAAGSQHVGLGRDDTVLPAGLAITGMHLEDSHERESFAAIG